MAEKVNEEFKAKFRKANKQCTVVNCEMGDFQKTESPNGVVICLGCMIKGENFGEPMVMPEGFKIPSK